MDSSQEQTEPLNETDYNKEIKGKFRKTQFIAALIVSLGGFSAGTVLAWTSPAFEYLAEDASQKNDTSISERLPGFTMSSTEEAIVGSTLNLGALIFAIPSGKLADLIGRKFVLILSGFLYLINFILIGCAKNVLMLVLARFFAGMGLVAACVVSPMYIGEIAEQSKTGILLSLFSVFIGLGVLYTTIVGAFTNWISLSLLLCVVPLVFLVGMFLLPETPIYLISVNNVKEAKRSLKFFQNKIRSSSEELSILQKQSLNQVEYANFWDFFTKRIYRVSLVAGVGTFALQQLCGINAVVFYTVPIFRAAGSSLDPGISAIITNSITCITGILPIFIIEKRGRKYFLTLSALLTMIGVLSLGIFFHLKQHSLNIPGLQLLPISGVVIFMTGFSLGLGPVPWILIAELYTPEIRGIASGVVLIVNWFCAFFVTLTYPLLMNSLGSYSTFYLYGFINFLGILFVRFAVPETRNMKVVAI